MNRKRRSFVLPTERTQREKRRRADLKNVFGNPLILSCILKKVPSPKDWIALRNVNAALRFSVERELKQRKTFVLKEWNDSESYRRLLSDYLERVFRVEEEENNNAFDKEREMTKEALRFLEKYTPNLQTLHLPGYGLTMGLLGPSFSALKSVKLGITFDELPRFDGYNRLTELRLGSLQLEMGCVLFSEIGQFPPSLESLDLRHCYGIAQIFASGQQWELPRLRKILFPPPYPLLPTDMYNVCNRANRLQMIRTCEDSPFLVSAIHPMCPILTALAPRLEKVRVIPDTITGNFEPEEDKKADNDSSLTIIQICSVLRPGLESHLGTCTKLTQLDINFLDLPLVAAFLPIANTSLPLLKSLRIVCFTIYPQKNETLLLIDRDLEELTLDFLACETEATEPAVLRLFSGPSLRNSLKTLDLRLGNPEETFNFERYIKRFQILYQKRISTPYSKRGQDPNLQWSLVDLEENFLWECNSLQSISFKYSDPWKEIGAFLNQVELPSLKTKVHPLEIDDCFQWD